MHEFIGTVWNSFVMLCIYIEHHRLSQQTPFHTFPIFLTLASRELLVACNVGISGSLDAAVEGTGTECHLSYRVSEFFYVPTPKLPPPELRRDQRPGQKSSSSGLSTISLSWGDAWAREARSPWEIL